MVVLCNVGVGEFGWSFRLSVSSDMSVSWVLLSVLRSVGVLLAGMWCPRIRGGVVDGAQGDGGLIRNMPDSGGVRWVLVGLYGIGESVFALGVVNGCMWCVGVGVCTFIMCESFKYSVCECMCGCAVC